MQFAAGKTSTQQEISDWISNLLYAGKNVIVAFDTNIKHFEKLIRSVKYPRPEFVDIISVSSPDAHLKSQYLDIIAEETGVSLSDIIKERILESHSFHITTCRGFINKLKMFEKQKGCSLSNEEILDCLEDYIHTEE